MAEPQAKPPAPADEQVPVFNPSGKLVTLAKSDLAAALDPDLGGYREATAEDVAHAKAEAKHGNLISQGMALQNATIRGATAGLGQAGIAKGLEAIKPEWGAAYKQSDRELKEHFKTTDTVGEIGGMIAGAAVGGELAQLGRLGQLGRLIPSAGIDALGGAAEHAVARQLTGLATRGALGRAATTAAKLGARGAVEGALYGGAHELSEEMLGDHELNAEKIIAAALESGGTGMLFGGGLGAAGSLAKSGANGLRGMLTEQSGSLRAMADDRAVKAMGLPASVYKEAEARFPGGAKALAETDLKFGIVGKDVLDASPGAMAARAEAALDDVGKKIGETYKSTPAVVTWGQLEDATEKVIAPLRKGAGLEGKAASLDGYVESLAEHLGIASKAREMAGNGVSMGDAGKVIKSLRDTEIPVQQLFEQRKVLDQIAFDESRALDPKLRVAKLREIRDGIQGAIYKGLDDSAAKAGTPGEAAALKELAHDYQGLSLINKGLESAAVSADRAPILGLKDLAAGVVGGQGVTGLAFTAGHKLVRERGDAFAAIALRKLADFAESGAGLKVIDDQVAKSASGVVSKTPKGAKTLPKPPITSSAKEPLAQRYASAVRDVASMNANAKESADRLTREPIPNLPKTSSAMTMSLLRSSSYLASKVPETISTPALGQQLKPSTDDASAASFLRTYEAVRDPMSVLRNMERGKVTPEGVEALRVVSPKMFEQLQRHTLEVVMDRAAAGTPIDYETRNKLSILLDIPTDPSHEPKMLAALQTPVAPEGETPQNPSATGPAPDRPVQFETQPNSLDRIEQ